jgi:hypothetical protein
MVNGGEEILTGKTTRNKDVEIKMGKSYRRTRRSGAKDEGQGCVNEVRKGILF